MPEQQYTCPACLEDYTRFTIHEHYDCGVEPLEPLEPECAATENGFQSETEKPKRGPKPRTTK